MASSRRTLVRTVVFAASAGGMLTLSGCECPDCAKEAGRYLDALEAQLKLQILGCCGLLDPEGNPDDTARCQCVEDRLAETTNSVFPKIIEAMGKCEQDKRQEVINTINAIKGIIPWAPDSSVLLGADGKPGNEIAFLVPSDTIEFSFDAVAGQAGEFSIATGTVKVGDSDGTLLFGIDGTLKLSAFAQQPDGSQVADVEELDWAFDGYEVHLYPFAANEAVIDASGDGLLRVAVTVKTPHGWVEGVFNSVWMELPFTVDGTTLDFVSDGAMAGTDVFPVAQTGEDLDYDDHGGCEGCVKDGGVPSIFEHIHKVIEDEKKDLCGVDEQ